jgi:hypothetical protein
MKGNMVKLESDDDDSFKDFDEVIMDTDEFGTPDAKCESHKSDGGENPVDGDEENREEERKQKEEEKKLRKKKFTDMQVSLILKEFKIILSEKP